MNKIEKKFGLKDIKKLVREIIPLIKGARIVTFSGPLGAGKTTLIQALAKELGVKDQVKSPTFTYFITYKTDEGVLYHFDLYRLQSADSFYEAGFDEYLYLPQSQVFIEWPEIIKKQLPEDHLSIELDYVEDDHAQRLLRIN